MKNEKIEKIDPDDCLIADAARRALEDVLSRDPTVMMIVYETAKQIGYASVPPSSAVAIGLYVKIGNVLVPDDG
jgi:hypothetical protein